MTTHHDIPTVLLAGGTGTTGRRLPSDGVRDRPGGEPRPVAAWARATAATGAWDA